MTERIWPVVRMASLLGLVLSSPLAATAETTHQTGRINNLTFVGDTVYLKLDTGLPDNCVGTAYGWMVIPAAYRLMQSWVTGMWLRGDIASITVTVYTNGLVGAYCQIDQIDPLE